MDIGRVADIFQICLMLDTINRCCNMYGPRPVSINLAIVGFYDLERMVTFHVAPQVTFRWDKMLSAEPNLSTYLYSVEEEKNAFSDDNDLESICQPLANMEDESCVYVGFILGE